MHPSGCSAVPADPPYARPGAEPDGHPYPPRRDDRARDAGAAHRVRLRADRLPVRARRQPAHLPAHRPAAPHRRAARPAGAARAEHHRRRPHAGRHRHRRRRRGQAARPGRAGGQEPVRRRPLLRGRLPPRPRAAQRAPGRRLPAGLGVHRPHARAHRAAGRRRATRTSATTAPSTSTRARSTSYGAISGNRLDDLRAGHGATGESTATGKRFHADWALWKRAARPAR